MLEADKHTNLKYSVIHISAKIIKFLLKNKIVKYDELHSYLSNTVGYEVKYIFVQSLSFLYLIGKIEYLIDLDAIKLLENENKQNLFK